MNTGARVLCEQTFPKILLLQTYNQWLVWQLHIFRVFDKLASCFLKQLCHFKIPASDVCQFQFFYILPNSDICLFVLLVFAGGRVAPLGARSPETGVARGHELLAVALGINQRAERSLHSPVTSTAPPATNPASSFYYSCPSEGKMVFHSGFGWHLRTD